MFKKQQGAVEYGDHWSDPMRIIGFDGETVWGQFHAGTLATATHLLRSQTAAELFALMITKRDSRPPSMPGPDPEDDAQQRGFHDLRFKGKKGIRHKIRFL